MTGSFQVVLADLQQAASTFRTEAATFKAIMPTDCPALPDGGGAGFDGSLEPPALGERGRQRLHHYDLRTAARASESPRDLCLAVGQAALALAGHSDGVAIDMYGFRFTRPQDLLPG